MFRSLDNEWSASTLAILVDRFNQHESVEVTALESYTMDTMIEHFDNHSHIHMRFKFEEKHLKFHDILNYACLSF